MEKRELEQNLALLESVNDQLMAELSYVDNLLRSVGFSQGLESVKGVAAELLKEQVGQEENCG